MRDRRSAHVAAWEAEVAARLPAANRGTISTRKRSGMLHPDGRRSARSGLTPTGSGTYDTVGRGVPLAAPNAGPPDARLTLRSVPDAFIDVGASCAR